MALSTDRATEQRDGKLLSVPVAASAVLYAGALIVANATGYAAPGSVAADLTAMGMATEKVDNSAGADGDLNIEVLRGRAFKFKNDGTNPVTQAHLGQDCYVFDDETVSSNATGTSVAGKVVDIESDGVWVFIG